MRDGYLFYHGTSKGLCMSAATYLRKALIWAQTTRKQLGNRHVSPVSREDLSGYGYALVGVAAVSLVIALLEQVARIGNLSLLYLLVVLYLAAWVGRGPALLASVLSFLAYDFLFIPPLYHFTVADPTEWLSLTALLLTSLVTGQLASTVRDRARDALQSQQRTATLYEFAQLIASATDQSSLFNDLVQHLLKVFAPFGMTGTAILLPGQGIFPTVQAIATTAGAKAEQDALRITSRNQAAEAAWALEHGALVGSSLEGTIRGAETPGSGSSGSPSADAIEGLVYFVPLTVGDRTVGVLGVTGMSGIRTFLVAKSISVRVASSPQQTLFSACCDQIALAIDRAMLQEQAIHAEALHESTQLKDVFLGSVTHDLRTPLASIKAAVTSLLSDNVNWSKRERQEFLRSIDESADRLNRLVGNLLDISRQEAGVAAPEKDWYLIGDVIATVLDRLELTAQLAGREVTIQVADDVPLVPMDHAQIEQVLTNLLENALKYSPADSPVRIVAAVPAVVPRELEVRVIDQGIGVPLSELRAIFDKFYRVQHVHLPWASDRPPTGTGLGLAICENIIRTHGGRIWAESTPSEGSTFIFRLPIPVETPQGALPEVRHDATPDSAPDAALHGTQTPSGTGEKPYAEG